MANSKNKFKKCSKRPCKRLCHYIRQEQRLLIHILILRVKSEDFLLGVTSMSLKTHSPTTRNGHRSNQLFQLRIQHNLSSSSTVSVARLCFSVDWFGGYETEFGQHGGSFYYFIRFFLLLFLNIYSYIYLLGISIFILFLKIKYKVFNVNVEQITIHANSENDEQTAYLC